MRFLIDGYNLLFSLGLASKRTEPKAFERARKTLLNWLHAAHGSDVASVTVVFDGLHSTTGRGVGRNDRGLVVRFAVGQLADDMIEEMIRREADPKRLVVVSSDHRLQVAANRRGCAAWDISRYVDWILARGHEPPKAPPPPAKPSAETPAETDHWMREFGDIDADPNVKRFNRPFEDFGE